MNKFSIFRIAQIFQIFRFGMVGLAASAMHFSIVVFFVQSLNFAPLIANLFGFIMGFQISYWGHSLWTFNDCRVEHRSALPKLFFVQIINLAANETLFYIFLSLHLPYRIALIIVLTVLPFFTFVVSKKWVFNGVQG